MYKISLSKNIPKIKTDKNNKILIHLLFLFSSKYITAKINGYNFKIEAIDNVIRLKILFLLFKKIKKTNKKK